MKDLVDVLVVGAGPVGLALACDLARRAVRVRVIDKLPEPPTTSRALGLHARTLEVFDDFAIADRAIARGLRLRGASLFSERRRIAHLSFEGIETPYPFVLVLPQSETERVLAEQLGALGRSVNRGCALETFVQDADGVTCELRHADGLAETIRAGWVVGCDGAHSTVRRALDIPFEGASLNEEFVLADVAIDGPLIGDELNAFLHASGVLALFPWPDGRWRVVAQVPSGDETEPTLAAFQKIVDERGPGGMRLSEPRWMSRFGIQQRRVRRHREGRVLLAGDAAHIHSPVGGQGMNTGIQDAHNLAWKLAWVIGGLATPALLDSYEIERGPVAKNVLRMTGLATRALTLRAPVGQQLRNLLLGLVTRVAPIRRMGAATMAELDIGYRSSPIVSQSWQRGLTLRSGPRAGDRAPDGELTDAETGEARRLFELLRGTRHTLLLFDGRSGAGGDALEAVADAADRALGDRISIHTLLTTRSRRLGRRSPLWIDPAGKLHARYGAAGPCVYLIRPDGHVGFRGRPPRPEPLLAYFKRLAAPPAAG